MRSSGKSACSIHRSRATYHVLISLLCCEFKLKLCTNYSLGYNQQRPATIVRRKTPTKTSANVCRELQKVFRAPTRGLDEKHGEKFAHIMGTDNGEDVASMCLSADPKQLGVSHWNRHSLRSSLRQAQLAP